MCFVREFNDLNSQGTFGFRIPVFKRFLHLMICKYLSIINLLKIVLIWVWCIMIDIISGIFSICKKNLSDFILNKMLIKVWVYRFWRLRIGFLRRLYLLMLMLFKYIGICISFIYFWHLKIR